MKADHNQRAMALSVNVLHIRAKVPAGRRTY